MRQLPKPIRLHAGPSHNVTVKRYLRGCRCQWCVASYGRWLDTMVKAQEEGRLGEAARKYDWIEIRARWLAADGPNASC